MEVRTRGAAVCLSMGLMLSCGDDVVTAELAEVCGQASPVRLLELGADELPLANLGAIRKVGDRLYFTVGPRERVDTGGISLPWYGHPATSTVYSTGLCGEDRVEIARDVWSVFSDERTPGLVLGCRGSGANLNAPSSFDLVALDPEGVSAPRLLIPAAGCFGAGWTDYGVVVTESLGEEVERVLLYPYPADLEAAPIDPIVLLEAVSSSHWRIETGADEVLAVNLDDELVRVDLSDGSTSVLEVGVGSFQVSPSGRYVQWFPPSAGEDLAAPVYLLDRETGVTHLLAEAALDRSWGFVRDDYTVLDVVEPEFHQRLVSLRTFSAVDLPPDRRLVARVDEGRWITSSSWFLSPYQLRDLASGAETTLLDADGVNASMGAEALNALLVPFNSPATGELQRIPYDGGPPQVLARRATAGYLELADGRVVSPVDLDADSLGALVLVDPDTLEEQQIDDRVYAPVGHYNQEALFGADVVTYAVSDGARSGVYLARLAPRR
ncbi:MAG: hypothetical protein R3A51_06310 [Nannocystaceae bacterium]